MSYQHFPLSSMKKKLSIKFKLMIVLVPLLLLTFFTAFISFTEKNFNLEMINWLEMSSNRKVIASEIKYLLLKYISEEKQNDRNQIKVKIFLELARIDEFYRTEGTGQDFLSKVMQFDNIDNSQLKSKKQWDDSVKDSIEIALELDEKDFDKVLINSIFDHLDEFSSQVDSENKTQNEVLLKIKSKIILLVWSFEILLVGLVILIYLLGVNIGNRIDKLTQNIINSQNSSGGNLPIVEGNDELSELNFTFNKLMSTLNATTVSKNFFENVLTSMTDALIVVDMNGQIKHHNQTMINLFGFSENEIANMKFKDILNSESESESESETSLSWRRLGIKTDQTNESTINNHEVLMVKNDQSVISCLISGALMIEEISEHSSYVLVIKDISKIKEVEKELEIERSKSIQAGKMATLGEMAGGVAHEINNPLAAIDGLSRRIEISLKKDPIPIEKVSTHIEKVRKHTQRIAKIVTGLRSFSRDGSQDPFEKVELSEVIKDSMELCHERIKNRGIKLVGFESLAHLPVVEGQQIPLTQVFVNLLNNSHDAIRDLEERWIKFDSEENENFIIINITDSGAGIPVEIRDKILQPFFTTKPVGVGTGLGLGIIVGILQKHNGNIKVDGSCKNTRFVITLPKFLNQENKIVS
jgi:PAS domain S-box-containing protein